MHYIHKGKNVESYIFKIFPIGQSRKSSRDHEREKVWPRLQKKLEERKPISHRSYIDKPYIRVGIIIIWNVIAGYPQPCGFVFVSKQLLCLRLRGIF